MKDRLDQFSLLAMKFAFTGKQTFAQERFGSLPTGVIDKGGAARRDAEDGAFVAGLALKPAIGQLTQREVKNGNQHVERMPGVKAVLVIQGEDDEYGTVAHVEAIQRGVAGTQAIILPRCGHSPHRDQPELILEAISKFVARLT